MNKQIKQNEVLMHTSNGWEPTSMGDLQAGDVFKMNYSDGTPVVDDYGRTIWTVSSPPKLVGLGPSTWTWRVEIEEPNANKT